MITIEAETPDDGNRPDDEGQAPAAPSAPDVAEVTIDVPADLAKAPTPFVASPDTELTNAEVGDLFSTLEKGLRAHRIYQANNPVYQGFVAALRAAIGALWTRTDSLQVG